MSNTFPEPGSRWFNDRRQAMFTVVGRVAAGADNGKLQWEVLYRADDWPLNEFRHCSLEEWHGINRRGRSRFVQVHGA